MTLRGAFDFGDANPSDTKKAPVAVMAPRLVVQPPIIPLLQVMIAVSFAAFSSASRFTSRNCVTTFSAQSRHVRSCFLLLSHFRPSRTCMRHSDEDAIDQNQDRRRASGYVGVSRALLSESISAVGLCRFAILCVVI